MITIEILGVMIYRDPILLPSLLQWMLDSGIDIKPFPEEKGQKFGLLIEPEVRKKRDSVYFSDGRPVLRRFPDRYLLDFENATYEAELTHVGDSGKRELIVCTNGNYER